MPFSTRSNAVAQKVEECSIPLASYCSSLVDIGHMLPFGKG
jgi:hypothetical protein